MRIDAPIPGTERWIEVAASQASTSIALVAPGADDTGVDTRSRFSVPDARIAHESMTARGVRVDELLRWDGMPPVYGFVDPDGKRFYVVKDPA